MHPHGDQHCHLCDESLIEEEYRMQNIEYRRSKLLSQSRMLSLIGLVILARFCWAGTFRGMVIDEDGQPLPGVMLYEVGQKSFSVFKGEPTQTGHVTRALTDREGQFEITLASETATLLARDMEDHWGLLAVNPWENQYTLHEPGSIQGTLWAGPNRLAGVEITATLQSDCRKLRVWTKVRTNPQGLFQLNHLMPGTYAIETIEEVPQVGCCFNRVVTRQQIAKVAPGEKTSVRLGGGDLPYLHGRLTSSEGKPLHAVWVHLTPVMTEVGVGPAVYADVSDVNGCYTIYDIPPGTYQLDLFRRLAQNSGSRVLEKQITLTIESDESTRPENQRDIEVDLSSFMPLVYGQDAPPFQATLLDGSNFDLANQQGKPVILHFYATYCSPCVQGFDLFDRLQDRLGDQAVVVGISLDKDRETCEKFIRNLNTRHPQIYDGPSTVSRLAPLYHLANIPTTYIIDSRGKVSQIDLFGATLEKYIRDHCLDQ